MFALVRITDSSRTSRHVRKVPIATSRRCAPSPIDKRQRASARPQGSLTPSIVLVLFWPCDLKIGTACIVISSFRFLPWLSPWLLSPQHVPWPYLPSPYLPSPWPSPLPCRPWLLPSHLAVRQAEPAQYSAELQRQGTPTPKRPKHIST